jgi:hypothetical protein
MDAFAAAMRQNRGQPGPRFDELLTVIVADCPLRGVHACLLYAARLSELAAAEGLTVAAE